MLSIKKTLNFIILASITVSLQCRRINPLPPPERDFLIIERDTTIGPDTIRFDQPVLVNGAKLTIEPGTYIYLGPRDYIMVTDSGKLFALGTEFNPITITGDSLWQGVTLFGSSGKSVFRNVKIIGSSGLANLVVMSSGKVTVVKSTFSDAKNYGISFGLTGNPSSIDSCKFLNNGGGDVFAYTLKPLFKFGKSNVFDASRKTTIYIQGNTEILSPESLRISNAGIKIEGKLTISADFRIAGPLRLFLSEDISVNYAQFHAERTEFRPVDDEWYGITVENGSVYLDSVVIAHGGLENSASLVLSNTTINLLRNLTIDSSASNGIYLDSPVDSLFNVTVRKSRRYPVVITEPSYVPVFQNCSFINNTFQYVRVTGFRISESLAWSNPGIPIYTDSLVIGGENSPILNLSNDLVLDFPGNGYLKVGELSGGLIANGVTFTALDTSGWKGIHIGPNMTQVQLIHCVIEYGGMSKNDIDSGNVAIHETTAPVIENSVIQHSHTYGIYLYGSANTTDYRQYLESSNMFYNNALGNIGPP